MSRWWLSLVVAVWACSGAQHPVTPAPGPGSAAPPGPTAATAPAGFAPLVDPDLQLLVTPSPEGHQPFIRAIDAAQTSIDMTMFHLTDPPVVDALVHAAARGVHVRVIVDAQGLKAKSSHAAFAKLGSGGVDVRASSPGFSLTHVKAMVVDGGIAFVTAINLTRDADKTRDLGVVTRQREVVAEVAALFAADWHNAETHGSETPELHVASLVVSPVSARPKLIALIESAQHELLVTVENLGDPKIDAALAAALQRHVHVRVIVPLCDKNPNPLYNLPAARELAAGGADVRMMPAPETAEQPYMHSKMILADGVNAYVGSVNFSINSTTKARELGIIFANTGAIAQIRTLFDADFAHAVPPPAETPARCQDVQGDAPPFEP
jgi:phosphatidylserine/phosphatidylglycerophosphate/cardiolipin synthase-like enzyme